MGVQLLLAPEFAEFGEVPGGGRGGIGRDAEEKSFRVFTFVLFADC